MSAGRGALIALILASTVAFVAAVTLERHETGREATTETAAQRAAEQGSGEAAGEGASSAERGTENPPGESTGHSEAGEGKRSHENAEHTEASTNNETTTATAPKPAAAKPAGTEAGHSESSEKLLGVNPESTGLLALAVVVSLLLALAVWRAGASPLVLGVVALALAAFCALDVREVVHQLNESRTGLALLAGLVAGLHLLAAVLAAHAARGARTPPIVA